MGENNSTSSKLNKDPILHFQLVNVERSNWVEFLSPADNEREITVINSLKQSIDVDLFLRPFTRSASLTITPSHNY